LNSDTNLSFKNLARELLAALLYPGEPVPPGFENEMTANSYFENFTGRLDKPLIGVEYVVELIDPRAKEPLYICTLCDKRCDPRNIIPQVTSHRHRMKYLVSYMCSWRSSK
jgi:hypothetical protein